MVPFMAIGIEWKMSESTSGRPTHQLSTITTFFFFGLPAIISYLKQIFENMVRTKKPQLKVPNVADNPDGWGPQDDHVILENQL